MLYCSYYQAHVVRDKTWFFVGVLRYFEHLAFDRTIDKQQGIFEFFVPQDLELYFLALAEEFEKLGIIHSLIKYPNRLAQQN